MRFQKLTAIAALAATLVFIAPPARGDDWKYDLYIYGLGSSMTGTAGIGPVEGAVDVSFSDLLENLELAFMGAFRAKKDKWAVMTDVIFAGLGAGGERANIDVDQLILEVDFAYQLTDTLEVFFGARYFDLDLDVALLGPLGLAAGGGEDWIDPLVGLRVQAPAGEKWIVVGRLDVGGFGVGSEFTWNTALHFGRRLGEKSTLTLGYRYLDVDYDDGEGLDRFKYDVVTSGPQIGIVFHF